MRRLTRLAGARPSPGTIIAVVALLLAVGGTSYALDKPGKPTARFYSGDDLRPTWTQFEYAATGKGSQICSGSVNPDGFGEFRMELDLPNGAKINSATVYYTDNDADDNVSFTLVYFFISEEEQALSYDELGPTFTSSGAATGLQTADISPESPVTVNTKNTDPELAVGIEGCEPDDPIIFHGARVEYTP